jgi:hypothetical protein
MFHSDKDPLPDLPSATSEDWKTTLTGLVRTKGFWVGVGVVALVLLVQANSEAFSGGVTLMVIAVLYFLPAVIARKKPNAGSVFVVNLFFGWTVIGWIIALAMAANNPQPQAVPQPAIQGPTGRTCPFCAEDIKPAAVVCRHCGRDLPA